MPRSRSPTATVRSRPSYSSPAAGPPTVTGARLCSPVPTAAAGYSPRRSPTLASRRCATTSGPRALTQPRAREALFGKFSMRSHLEELVAAVGVLAGRDSIDETRIAGLGNSEGTLHILHYATSRQNVPLAGIVLCAPPGRSVGEVLLSQLALQAAQVPGGAELMPLVESAAARYDAGQPMNPDQRLPDNVKMVLASFEAPANLPLARELWAEDAAGLLPLVEIPTLVLIGRKDLQIDVTLDGGPLEKAATGKDNITFAYPANANHVFKEDTRTAAEVAAAPGDAYNQDGIHLDPEALETILGWLRGVLV